MTIHLCENCSTQLVSDTRKLGKGSHSWFLCPECGLRVKKSSHWYDEQELDNFIKEKNRINSNNIEEE